MNLKREDRFTLRSPGQMYWRIKAVRWMQYEEQKKWNNASFSEQIPYIIDAVVKQSIQSKKGNIAASMDIISLHIRDMANQKFDLVSNL